MNETRMLPGNGGELLNAFELPVEGPVVGKSSPIYDFDGVKAADDVPRQPDLAVSALAHTPHQVMVGNLRPAVTSTGRGGCDGSHRFGEAAVGKGGGENWWGWAGRNSRERGGKFFLEQFVFLP